MPVRLFVSPRFATVAFIVLVCVVFGMASVSFVTDAHEYLTVAGLPLDAVSKLDQGTSGVPWLSADAEQSIPAWFSSSALLVCSILLVGLARSGHARSSSLKWNALAVIFLLLSMDEAVAFHEKAIAPLRSALGTDAFLYYAWVIPGAILVVVLALVYARFVLALPARSRWLVVLAALLFVGGALVTEVFGARQVAASGQSNLAYVALSTTEELLEMLGVAVFIYALMLLSAPGVRIMRARDGVESPSEAAPVVPPRGNTQS